MPWVINYYLRGSGINVLQPSNHLIIIVIFPGTRHFLILMRIYETVYHRLLNLHTLSSNLDHE